MTTWTTIKTASGNEYRATVNGTEYVIERNDGEQQFELRRADDLCGFAITEGTLRHCKKIAEARA